VTRSWLALGVLSLGVLVIGVDGTVLAVATPLITKDLESTATQILWIGDIYSFVAGGSARHDGQPRRPDRPQEAVALQRNGFRRHVGGNGIRADR
jgi:hypothetical protein